LTFDLTRGAEKPTHPRGCGARTPEREEVGTVRQVRIRRSTRRRVPEDEARDDSTGNETPAGEVDELLALIEAALRG
jgi:hypothetical protein